MTGTRITIRLRPDDPRVAGNQFICHQFRNFGEDLVREFRETHGVIIDLSEIDRATTEVSFLVKHRKILRSIKQTVDKIRSRHFFDDNSDVILTSLKDLG